MSFFSSDSAPPASFLHSTSLPARSGFLCHSLCSSLLLLASIHVCVLLTHSLDLSCLCIFLFFCIISLPFSVPLLLLLPAFPSISQLSFPHFGYHLCPCIPFPHPGSASPSCLISTDSTGLTTSPAPRRLRCYTCSFAKPCYPVPTECQDDEVCGISVGTSGKTLV